MNVREMEDVREQESEMGGEERVKRRGQESEMELKNVREYKRMGEKARVVVGQKDLGISWGRGEIIV